MSAQMKLQARNLARQHFRENDVSPASYTRAFEDEHVSNLDLPISNLSPALQEIALQKQKQKPSDRTRTIDVEEDLEPALENVTVHVRLVPHPEDEAAQAMPEESWNLSMKRVRLFLLWLFIEC